MMDHNDPRLIDYALGEMTPDEANAFEAELNLPENAEALKTMQEFQMVADAAKDALAKEPTGQLRAEQREAVVEQAAAPRNITPIAAAPRARFLRRLAATALAACLVVTFGWVGVNILGRSGVYNAPLATEEMHMGRIALSDPAPASEGNVKVYTDPASTRGRASGASAAEPKEASAEASSTVSDFLQDVQVGGSIQTRNEENETGAYREKKDESARVDAYTDLESVGRDGDTAVMSEADAVAGRPLENPYMPNTPRLTELPALAPKPEPAPAQEARTRDELSSLGYAAPPAAASPAPNVAVTAAPEIKRQEAGSPAATELAPLVVEYPEPFFGGTPLDYWGPNLERQDFRSPWTPQSPGAEKYLPIIENAFLDVVSKPLSTFSIDVDTGAYSNVRRFLQQGQLPPPDAVRIEEMVNYFKYDLAQPTGEAPFSVTIEMADCPWAQGHKLARVALQGRTIVSEERNPANLVFLIDVSGSMSNANKLPLAKEAMKALLNELQPHDRVAIVTYASGVSVPLNSTSCMEKNRIRSAIDSLGAGGSTHGSQGIQQAYRIARENFIPGGINRVLLATDGDFNVGVTGHDALMELITREAKSRVFLTVLGFGYGNLKDATLEQIANKGNGNYAYIDTFAEARRVLVDQISGTLIAIAKDVKIQVEFNPQHVQAYRLIGYENRALADRDFNDDTKDAGEIGAGHQVTALYQLVPKGVNPDPGVDPLKYQSNPEPETAPDRPTNPEWITVKLRYKEPEGDVSRLIEIPWGSTGGDLRQATPDMQFVSSIAAFGMMLRNSQHRGTANFDMVMALAEAGKKSDPERQAFIDLVVTAKTLTRR